VSDRLSPEVMVPLTGRAFMRGHLVHTNKILVLLGDNYFLGRLQLVIRIRKLWYR
jgi:prefoldin subunit 5